MTYIACVIQPNGIVVATDSRASYFDDIIEPSSEKVVGKRIRYFWDGNRKIFLLRRANLFVACQGLLFWGNSRYTLSKLLTDFEAQVLGNMSLTIQNISSSLHQFFRHRKREGRGSYEAMHFIIGGFENGAPKAFYVNTYHAEIDGVQELPLQENTGMYINGDGQARYRALYPKEELRAFVIHEIMEQHRLKPFDIGDEIEVLEIDAIEARWYKECRDSILYNDYDSLMAAINEGKVQIRTDGCPADLMLS